MKPDTAGPAQPDQRPTPRAHDCVVVPPPDRVDPEPVTRGRVEAREHLAVSIEDADGRPELADVGDLLGVEVNIGRAMDIAPLGNELAAPVEHLDAAVLPIADVHESLRVDPQAMRQVEL